MLEPPFTEDFASPYSVNMSLFLPDVMHLHPSLCRTVAQIKTEPLHTLMPPACQGNEVPAVLSEYSGAFKAVDTPSGGFSIKMEVPALQEVSMFQLLNTDLEKFARGLEVTLDPTIPLSLPNENVHAGPDQNSAKPANSSQTECFPFNQHLSHEFGPSYWPPSPPNSDPPSPDRSKEFLHNLPPPPSYGASIASKLTFQTPRSINLGQTSSSPLIQDQDYAARLIQNPEVIMVQHSTLGSVRMTPGVDPLSRVLAHSAPAKYNRRSNPDLEKRRIHHCSYPGEKFQINSVYLYNTNLPETLPQDTVQNHSNTIKEPISKICI